MHKRLSNLGLGLLALSSVFFMGCGSDDAFIANTPQGQLREFILIPNVNANTVAIRGIDIGTGNTAQLSLVGTGAGSQPNFVKVNPTRPIFYTANNGNSTVGVYSIDANGNAAALPTNNIAGPTGTRAIFAHPNGNFIYVAGNAAIRSYSVGADGSLTQAGPDVALTGGARNDGGFTQNANGLFLHIPTTQGVQTFNVGGNGVLTANSFQTINAAVVPGYNTVNDVSIHPTGELVLATVQAGGNANDDAIVPFVVQANGSLARQANQATGLFDIGLGQIARNGVFYVGDLNNGEIRGFNVGPLGVLTQITGSPFTATGGGSQTALDPTESLVFSANNGSSMAVNRRLSDNTLVPGTNTPFTENLNNVFVFDFFQFVQQI